MARDDKIRMPSSSAGITQFYDVYKSSISMKPQQVIILTIIIMVLVLSLHWLA